MSYPVGRSRFSAALLLGAWLAGTSGVLAWWLQVDPAALRQAAALAAVLGGGVVALLAWRHSPRGVLAWSGEAWSWSRGAQVEGGAPEAVLDVQFAMCLRWQSSAGVVRWLWVERHSERAHWDALRRAVYSRARPEAPPGARPRGEGRT